MDSLHMTQQRPYWWTKKLTVAMLVYQNNPVGIELFSHVKSQKVKSLFSCKKFLLFPGICMGADHVSENDLFLVTQECRYSS